jgi:hypothetical protein
MLQKFAGSWKYRSLFTAAKVFQYPREMQVVKDCGSHLRNTVAVTSNQHTQEYLMHYQWGSRHTEHSVTAKSTIVHVLDLRRFSRYL